VLSAHTPQKVQRYEQRQPRAFALCVGACCVKARGETVDDVLYRPIGIIHSCRAVREAKAIALKERSPFDGLRAWPGGLEYSSKSFALSARGFSPGQTRRLKTT
jgi:hypothetical protein